MNARLRLLACASLGMLMLGGTLARASEAAGPPVALADLGASTDAALGRADLAAYRGWLKYLRLDAQTAERRGAADASDKARRLGDWLARIAANPGLLATLTGVQEWAYESPVDDSGQPFRIAIPTDYDPSRPAPLTVYMHGYSGNHIEHSAGMASHPGSFDVAVLGRSRGGGYRALSEADVLQAVGYIQSHWAIDPDRVSLNGGSMGGGGTYRLGSRYPHLWSSGRPSCGFASYVPLGNLLTLPIYATHSLDDPVVSVLHEVGPLQRLRDLGGQVIFDETNGYGHAVWNYKEGNERGLAWEKSQVRADSRSVRHIDYTALDGGALRGWWAEVAEWGPSPKPARFVLAAGNPNLLFAGLTNIERLRLRLSESPFDPALPLRVSVNGAVPIVLPAPLPRDTVLARGERGWTFEAGSPALAFRLHAPGSASLLYDGEPLLIVYGTRGTDAERTAMRAAAESASRSPNPSWAPEGGESGADGVPHSQNLYGRLNTKADTRVTDLDMARCHLVLIGTAAQNAVVARLAASLPVRLEGGSISCSDGATFEGAHRALGLVYFNPLAPGRLIFWVASDDPAAYAAGSPVPAAMGGGAFIYGNALTADLVVMDARDPTLVVSRAFDSRWRWLPGRESSPLLGAALATTREFSLAVGEAVRKAAAADFALVGNYGAPAAPPISPGVTRVADVVPLFANQPVGLLELSGDEALLLAKNVGSKDSPMLLAGYDAARIRPEGTYRVALPVGVLWDLSSVQPAPRAYRLTDLDTGEAIERFLAGK